MSRHSIYWTANLCFSLLVAVGCTVGSINAAHPLYLVLLFALCSSPIVNITRLNDRYALLALFSVVYFQFYGTLDFINLWRGTPTSAANGILSETELLIVVGGAFTHIAYRLGCGQTVVRHRIPKDWNESALVVIGCALWLLSTWSTWKFNVFVITNATASATAQGLASLSGIQTMAFLLANMLQPLSVLILAYAQCRYRRPYMVPLLVGIVVVQLLIGFVMDVKGEALNAAVLVVITKLFTDGKLSKTWVIALAAFIAVAFPALQANRILRYQYRLDRVEVAQHVIDTVKQAFAAGEQVSNGDLHAQNVFERLSLKGSVEMIVLRTGKDVPYQYGYTLTPIWATFIPKIIWPNKPDVQTGQLVNKEFGVNRVAYVYISPSHLGELFWNFGWAGVLIGMSLIGALLGYIGRRIDMTNVASITRLMVAAVTIRMLILGSESTIAATYVVWLRSMAAIGILHWLLAKQLSFRASENIRANSRLAASDGDSVVSFPNLLR